MVLGKSSKQKITGKPIVAVLWQDAAFSFDEKPPREKPLPKLTFGILIEENKKFIQVAMNSGYNEKTKEINTTDGFFIPKGVIIEIKELGNYGR